MSDGLKPPTALWSLRLEKVKETLEELADEAGIPPATLAHDVWQEMVEHELALRALDHDQ